MRTNRKAKRERVNQALRELKVTDLAAEIARHVPHDFQTVRHVILVGARVGLDDPEEFCLRCYRNGLEPRATIDRIAREIPAAAGQDRAEMGKTPPASHRRMYAKHKRFLRLAGDWLEAIGAGLGLGSMLTDNLHGLLIGAGMYLTGAFIKGLHKGLPDELPSR